jgi:hypothetical protein
MFRARRGLVIGALVSLVIAAVAITGKIITSKSDKGPVRIGGKGAVKYLHYGAGGTLLFGGAPYVGTARYLTATWILTEDVSNVVVQGPPIIVDGLPQTTQFVPWPVVVVEDLRGRRYAEAVNWIAVVRGLGCTVISLRIHPPGTTDEVRLAVDGIWHPRIRLAMPDSPERRGTVYDPAQTPPARITVYLGGKYYLEWDYGEPG